MSFASQIKNEIIKIQSDQCCKKAELAAIIRMNGVLFVSKRVFSLDVQTENAAIARRIYTLIKENYDYPIELLVRKKMKLKKNNVYIVRIKYDVKGFLTKLSIKFTNDKIEQSITEDIFQDNCCKRAYLRGAFLSRGSVNNPETSSYHLEVFNFYKEHNDELKALMNSFKLHARQIQRRNGFIVYLKEAEKITEFLNIVGAHNALFKFEDVRIVRDMRNSVNRLVNCETANLNKTIQASVRQVESIKLIDEIIGLENIPARLREIAETRLKYPEVTLKELGELIPSGKLSKSGVNHRLKKIEEMAEEARFDNI